MNGVLIQTDKHLHLSERSIPDDESPNFLEVAVIIKVERRKS